MAAAKSASKTVDASGQSAEQKKKSLLMAMGKIEKDFGKGAIMRMGDTPKSEVEVISTGSLKLDHILGVGGVPKGRVIEIYGPESSGKTTLATHIVAEAQKAGGLCAFIDAEHAFDSTYAAKLGVDIQELLISQPDTGEQALEICETLVRSAALDVIVIDSVAALVPRAEIEGDMGDSHVGLQARLMSQALRKLTGIISRTSTVVIFINQLREKIGGMGYGPNETTTGGRALKFYASVRIDIRRIGAIKDGDEVVGNKTKVKIVKNKVAPPFREAEVDVVYGEGISPVSELVDLAVEYKFITKSGAWFGYKDSRVQGRENMKTWLKENAEERIALLELVRAKLNKTDADEVPLDEREDDDDIDVFADLDLE
jgi:recombination protein RecA